MVESFIDALIKLGRMDDARKILEQGKANGLGEREGQRIRSKPCNF